MGVVGGFVGGCGGRGRGRCLAYLQKYTYLVILSTREGFTTINLLQYVMILSSIHQNTPFTVSSLTSLAQQPSVPI